ncbi:MAG: hypothetical protein KG003_09170 [Bacteroidetes bacterium]|nr:hypothetical protein [Bacteroidota bacterium]
MENPELNNDLIDKYLRDELEGAELDSFLAKMESDSAFKKDVEFRKILVRGIQEHGAAQLKNFIRQRTTQRKIMTISFNTWYYAAAAVAILLVASTVLLWVGQKNEMQGTEIADVKKTEPKEQIPASGNEPAQVVTGNKSELADSTKSETYLALEDANNSGSGAVDTDRDGVAESDQTNAYPDVVMIASNIPVIPIQIEPATSEMKIESSSVPQSRKPVLKREKEATADKNVLVDSGLNWSVETIAKADSDNETVIPRFNLSFGNTRDAKPQIELLKKSNSGTNDLMVYNLPYDNPIILNYNNKFYLKTGDKYYEFNLNKAKKQAVAAVTDKNILEALNK